ncbi:uncharacterized protein LOC127725976 isoform X1 [Mytilus californianus]|uniref:uncharacterized protein LOC127725976 isoform X1 n=2 Tax=Mytilus californianus TaxID=6549 RepID=UPI002246A564|nr:uncharacterized protein LOC127725976 isoform X1 [Mytilus californianus]
MDFLFFILTDIRMPSTTYSPFFSDSCVLFNKGNCGPFTRLIDPCSCTKYFQCVNKEVIPRECPQGTAYDHTVPEVSSSYCRNEADIIIQQICTQDTSWTRCSVTANATDSELLQIQSRCKGTTTATTVGPVENTSNVGAIVGGILAGLLVVILLIAAYILYKRGYVPSLTLKKKRLKSKHPLHNQPSIANPQYFGQPGMHMTIGDHHDRDIYEEYATIDDTGHDPNFPERAPRLPERPPSLQSNKTDSGDRKISVTSVQSYMEPSPTLKYGFVNRGLNIQEEDTDSNGNDRFYTEIFPDPPSNGQIQFTHSHNQSEEEISPYDNSLHV